MLIITFSLPLILFTCHIFTSVTQWKPQALLHYFNFLESKIPNDDITEKPARVNFARRDYITNKVFKCMCTQLYTCIETVKQGNSPTVWP